MKLLRTAACVAVLGFAGLASGVAQAFELGPTTPGKWGPPAPGTGATITWSLMSTGTSCAADGGGICSSLSDFMPVGYMTSLQSAFAAWSSVANVTFLQVPDDGAAFNAPTTSGDIRIGGHVFDGPGGILAHGYYPPVNGGGTAAGDIHFDVNDPWENGFGGPGFDIFQVFAHELGHALGLDHTAVLDSLMNPYYTEAFSGPQADDIAGMQYLYGAAVVATPEPGSLALLAFGLFGFALTALRKKQHASA